MIHGETWYMMQWEMIQGETWYIMRWEMIHVEKWYMMKQYTFVWLEIMMGIEMMIRNEVTKKLTSKAWRL